MGVRLMAFWIFMLVADLLVPVIMIYFGRLFSKKPPKEINSLFGYRTAMSMKNKDTWSFAHRYCGRLWYVWGLAVMAATIIVMLFVHGKTTGTVGTVGGIVCFVQIVPLLVSIALTEKALKKTFDEDGGKR